MEKKKRLLVFIITAVVLIAAVGLIVYLILHKDSTTPKPSDGESGNGLYVEDLSKEYPKIKKYLKSSKKFSGSKIKEDTEAESISIDDKYTIGVRGGYIHFEIPYEDGDVNGYCDIVEAIQNGLGVSEGVRNACELALKGSVSNDFMMVSFEEDKMFVTVNTESKTSKIEEAKIYNLGDQIAIGTRNFGLNYEGYSLANTSSGFNATLKATRVCFTVFNKARTPREFIVRYYDVNKAQVHEGTFSYKGERVAEHTCIEWENEDTVKYFSIN